MGDNDHLIGLVRDMGGKGRN